jgi:hypothetical protein
MKISEIVTERTIDANNLVSWIKNNQVGLHEFFNYIRDRYDAEVISTGSLAYVLSGKMSENRDYVLKIVGNGDVAYELYADISKKNPANPLFPKILFNTVLTSGEKIYIIESLIVDRGKYYDFGLSAREFEEEIVYLQHQIITGKTVTYINATNSAFLDSIENAGAKVDDFLKWITECRPLINQHNIDLHSKNVGWRENGEMVLFDAFSSRSA